MTTTQAHGPIRLLFRLPAGWPDHAASLRHCTQEELIDIVERFTAEPAVEAHVRPCLACTPLEDVSA